MPSRVAFSLGPRFLMGAFLCALVALGPLTPSSHGAVIITFVQIGSNVFANGNGTLNTTNLSFAFQSDNFAIVQPNTAAVALGPNLALVDVYAGPNGTGPSSIGPGGLTGATFASGDPIGILGSAPLMDVPQGYTSGSSLSGSAEWINTTISDLGLTPGTYKWTWGSGATADFFEVVIPSASVPEPATIILLTTGLLAVGFINWRRLR